MLRCQCMLDSRPETYDLLYNVVDQSSNCRIETLNIAQQLCATVQVTLPQAASCPGGSGASSAAPANSPASSATSAAGGSTASPAASGAASSATGASGE